MIAELQNFLQEVIGSECKIESPCSGGCINQCYRISQQGSQYFVKCNNQSIFNLFQSEARGLEELAAAAVIRVPRVYAQGESGSYQFLLCEYIEEGRKGRDFFEQFGRELAALHRHRGEYYGFVEDNYLGSAKQKNEPSSSWIEFFRDRRLNYQFQWAKKQGFFPHTEVEHSFEKLLARLDDLLIDEPPSLLHGDLWAGNYMVDSTGQAVLIDPAVYYGNREADLAMTELFSGFSPSFYASYAEVYPLQPGYAERRDLYNLYHLLNHLNIFGSSYLPSVEAVIKDYAS